MSKRVESFEDDVFVAALAHGLERHAAEVLQGTDPGTRVHVAVRRARRRRVAASLVAGAVAVSGLAGVAQDPAGSIRVVKETAAFFGLSFDRSSAGGAVGEVGRDEAWVGELEGAVARARIGDAQQDEEILRLVRGISYRVLWADDLAGKRRALIAEKSPSGERLLILAEGPAGAAGRQMRAAAGGESDEELLGWTFDREPGNAVLVVAPRADAVSASPMVLDESGRPGTEWTELTGLGNGVWVAEKLGPGAHRVRARIGGEWIEQVVRSQPDVPPEALGFPLGLSRDYDLPPPTGGGSVMVQAARLQSQDAGLLLGRDWTRRASTWSRPHGDRTVVAHAEQGSSGAWAVTAYAWSTDPTIAVKGHEFEADGETWGDQAYSDVVTAPRADADDLLVPLRLHVGDVMSTWVVVLAPERAATVEADGASYPVESRLALVPDGGWNWDSRFVAKDASGKVLATTPLPVEGPVEGLLVPR